MMADQFIDVPSYTIVYGPLFPPGTYTPKYPLKVRGYASTSSRMLRLVKKNEPIRVYGYWVDLKQDEYWLAVDALLSEWVAHRHGGEWLGALVVDNMAESQKEEQG